MPIRILCPACGRSLWLPPAQLGRHVACPSCRYEWITEKEDAPEPAQRARRSRPADWEDDYDDEDDPQYVEEAPRRDLVPHRGGTILTLGLVGLCLSFLAPLGILLGLAAWVMGQGDLRQMKRNEMDSDGQGMTLGGIITGILGLIMGLFFLLACAGLWTAAYSFRPPGVGRPTVARPGAPPAPMPPPPVPQPK